MSDTQPTQPQPTEPTPPVEVTSDPTVLDPALAPQPVADEPLTSSRRKVIITIIVVAVVAVLAIVGTIIAINLAPKADPTPAGGETPAAEQPVEEIIDGIVYENGDYGSSVVFPGAPTEQETPLPIQGFEVVLESVIYQEGESALVVNTTRYPAELLSDTDSMLQGSVDGAIGNVPGAELVSDEDITLAGMPARKIVATSPAGEVRLIIAIEEDVQYQLLAANSDETTAEAFFASFKKL